MQMTYREPTEVSPNALVRVSEAAKMRRVPSRRIRDAIKSGELEAIQIGAWTRVRIRDLDEWISSHGVRPRGAHP